MEVNGDILGGGPLTATLNDILVVPTGTKIRLHKISISNGETAGKISIVIEDSSAGIEIKLLNSVSIEANGQIVEFDGWLNSGDKIKASATETTDAEIIVFGMEILS